MPADRKPLKFIPGNVPVALMAAFFLIQVIIDFAHSVTAFPFEHYGMFSESLSSPDSLLRYEVIVDDQVLEPNDFRIYRWDMVQQPLAAFDHQSVTGDFAFDKQKFHATLPGIYSRISANLDNSPALAADFPDWYRSYLSRLIGHPIHSLKVNQVWYRYQNGHFTILHSSPLIGRRW